MNLSQIQIFLGCSLAINASILILSSIMLVVLKGEVKSIHARMFNIGQEELNTSYFNYLANYKILIIFFNLVPYLVLRFFF